MTSDYVDNWDVLSPNVQEVLEPLLTQFDTAADLLFDRRLNLSFEAAVKALSIPGIALLTEALRALGRLLEERVTVTEAKQGILLFDHVQTLTAYDLPLYTPCLYLSQLAQAMHEQNVRVWKESTALEIVAVLLCMARFIRPDIEVARVCIAAIHDMASLYPAADSLIDASATQVSFPNAGQIASLARQLLTRRSK